jgi:aryl-alcohol dehydrogenase-like predicted oxidoreductase
VGISINRWQPANVLKALATDLVDSVQVVYNIFDQAPEDELFVECRRRNIAVVARVPFDEGSLTGTLTATTTWPQGDFRNIYFQPDNLKQTVERVAALRPHVPAGMSLPELALRFILENKDVSTVIPGMRKLKNVQANLAASGGQQLPPPLMAELRNHRWDRWIDIP